MKAQLIEKDVNVNFDYKQSLSSMVVKKLLFVPVLLILLFTFICDMTAQDSWSSNGPFLNPKVEGITYFHSDPNIMLAGDNGVIYKSTDAGEIWEYLCFFDYTITSIEFDPFLENQIYVGMASGMYKTEDYGKTWTQILNKGKVNTIAIDKNNTDIIYAGTGVWGSTSGSETTGIFKSTNRGETWAHVFSEDIDVVNDIIIDLNDSDDIYAGIRPSFSGDIDEEFLISNNGGNTWIKRNVPTTSGTYGCSGLIQGRGPTNNLYCISTSSGNHKDLWRSTTKGYLWEPINVYYFDGPVSVVVADPKNPNILYATGNSFSDRGLFISTNEGDNWTNIISDIPSGVYEMLINPDDSRLTMTTSNDGILQSESWGSWKSSTIKSFISDLAVHPNDEEIIFATVAGNKLFRSIDGNNTWEEEGSSSVNDNIVAFFPFYPVLVGAASGKYFHKSTDGGDVFSNTYYSFANCSDPPCDSYPEEMLFEPKNANKIIIGTSGKDGVLSMSINGGTQWGYLEFGVSAFVFDPNNTNNIYAGTKDDRGFYKIEDIWSTSPTVLNITPSIPIGSVNSIAVDVNSNLYVASSNGLWKRTDLNWDKLTGLPDDNITAILLDENNHSIYVGTENNSVYSSTNMGASWSAFNDGLENASITKLARSETNANRFYAGTKRRGLWSTDLVVGLNDEIISIPTGFILHQNYPNPFDQSTSIKYQIPQASNVTLEIFDFLGRSVKILVDEHKSAGTHEIEFSSQNLSSGIYFYRINAGEFSGMKKMLLLE